MQPRYRFILVLSGLAALAVPAAIVPASPLMAQSDNQAPPQIALTQAQIDALLDSQADVGALQPKEPPAEGAKPDPALQAKMESAVKKHGFASLDDYEAVSGNIEAVMAGLDPETKRYVGPTVLVKRQMAQIQADKSIPAKDKAQALEEMKQALASPPPPKPSAGNIQLVAKNYDKLAQAMQGDSKQ